MPVVATFTPNRPNFTLADTISPEQFNGVTLHSGSVSVSGALADDGSTPATGTQSFQTLTAGTITVSGSASCNTLTTTGAATLASASVIGAATMASASVSGTLTVVGQTTLGRTNTGQLIASDASLNGGLVVNGTSNLIGNTTVNNLQFTSASGTGNLNCGSMTVTGAASVGSLVANSFRAGPGTNPATAISFKTATLSVTLNMGQTKTYEVDTGGGGHTGAVASVCWQPGLTIVAVWPPSNNGNSSVRLDLRNDTGANMVSSGVKASVISFIAS